MWLLILQGALHIVAPENDEAIKEYVKKAVLKRYGTSE
jgi:hypothetical protein